MQRDGVSQYFPDVSKAAAETLSSEPIKPRATAERQKAEERFRFIFASLSTDAGTTKRRNLLTGWSGQICRLTYSLKTVSA